MSDSTALHSLDLAVRGGLVSLMLFAAALLWREHRRSVVARLACVLGVGVAAYALQSAPGFAALPLAWHAPVVALSAGNAVVFWLFARALFDDAFHWHAWHGVVWGAVAALALVSCVLLRLGRVIDWLTLAFAALAVAQSLNAWRVDLVEGRRRLRCFIVAAGAGYTIVNMAARWWLPASALASLIDVMALSAIAVAVMWQLVRASGAALLGPPARPVATDTVAEDSPSEPPDTRLMASLQRLMNTERAYREDGLTIGALAARLCVPEYRLRRAINQGLGHRNFNAFVNHYRVEEAKAALADPARAPVPVLTIAMDAGFQSLGPFNRAFKADTGLTPTEFRRTLGGCRQQLKRERAGT